MNDLKWIYNVIDILPRRHLDDHCSHEKLTNRSDITLTPYNCLLINVQFGSGAVLPTIGTDCFKV